MNGGGGRKDKSTERGKTDINLSVSSRPGWGRKAVFALRGIVGTRDRLCRSSLGIKFIERCCFFPLLLFFAPHFLSSFTSRKSANSDPDLSQRILSSSTCRRGLATQHPPPPPPPPPPPSPRRYQSVAAAPSRLFFVHLLRFPTFLSPFPYCPFDARAAQMRRRLNENWGGQCLRVHFRFPPDAVSDLKV